MVNWAAYNGRSKECSDDDDFDSRMEVADNAVSDHRGPRGAILNRKRQRPVEEVEEEYSRLDREKVEASVVCLEATFSAWLTAEREKQNIFLKRKT